MRLWRTCLAGFPEPTTKIIISTCSVLGQSQKLKMSLFLQAVEASGLLQAEPPSPPQKLVFGLTSVCPSQLSCRIYPCLCRGDRRPCSASDLVPGAHTVASSWLLLWALKCSREHSVVKAPEITDVPTTRYWYTQCLKHAQINMILYHFFLKCTD